MTIDGFINELSTKRVEESEAIIQFKKENKPIVAAMKGRKQLNLDINEKLKAAPDQTIEEGKKIYTFNKVAGVKINIEEPYTVKTLPTELVKTLPGLRSSDFKKAAHSYDIYSYITPKGVVAGELVREIRFRNLDEVPTDELNKYYQKIEDLKKCDINLFDLPPFPDLTPRDEEIIDLNIASRAEINRAKHVTNRMTNEIINYRRDHGRITFLDQLLEGPYNLKKKDLDRISKYVRPRFSDEVDEAPLTAGDEDESEEAMEDRKDEEKERQDMINKGEAFEDADNYFDLNRGRKNSKERVEEEIRKTLYDEDGNVNLGEILDSKEFKGLDIEGMTAEIEKKLMQDTPNIDSEARRASDMTEEELEELRGEVDKAFKGNLPRQLGELAIKLWDKVWNKSKKYLHPPKEIKDETEFSDEEEYDSYLEEEEDRILTLRDMLKASEGKLSKVQSTGIARDTSKMKENDVSSLIFKKAERARSELRTAASQRERFIMDELISKSRELGAETFDTPQEKERRDNDQMTDKEKLIKSQIRELQGKIQATDRKLEERFEQDEKDAAEKLKIIKARSRARRNDELSEDLPSGYDKGQDLAAIELELADDRRDVSRYSKRERELIDAIDRSEIIMFRLADKGLFVEFDALKKQGKDAEKELELVKEAKQKAILRVRRTKGLFYKRQLENANLDENSSNEEKSKLLTEKEGFSDKRKAELEELIELHREQASELSKEMEALEKKFRENPSESIEKERNVLNELLIEAEDFIERYRDEINNGGSIAKKLINLDSCSKAQLQTFDGIGSKTADRIIKNRPYAYLNDVMEKVKGFGGNKIGTFFTNNSYRVFQTWDPGKEKPDEFQDDFLKDKKRDKDGNNIHIPKKLTLTNKHRFLANQFLLSQLCRKVNLNTDPLSIIQAVPTIGTDLGIQILENRAYNDLIELQATIDNPRITLEFLENLKKYVLPEFKIKELIDLNEDSLDRLMQLPHIAENLAVLIIQIRPIEYTDDLMKISGISQIKVDDINKRVVQSLSPGTQGLIDLNKDVIVTLSKLPGISTGKAKAIIANRPYKYVEDLIEVKGISEKTVNELKHLVRPGSIDKVNRFDKFDLNECEFEELTDIPEVGVETANKVFRNRPIEYLEQLKPVLTMRILRIINPFCIQDFKDGTDQDDLVDLNKATVDELKDLPGIGKGNVDNIIFNRPIEFVDDLINFMSPIKLMALEPLVIQTYEENIDLLDLNEATKFQLVNLPTVSKRKAEKIIANRPYEFLDELEDIKGITLSSIKQFQDFVLQTFEDEDDELVDLNKDRIKFIMNELRMVPDIFALAVKRARPIKFLDELLKVEKVRKGKDGAPDKLEVVKIPLPILQEINPLVKQNLESDPRDKELDKLDLNLADAKEIRRLPGVGKKTGDRIIKARPIKFLEKLFSISGLTYKTIRAIADLVVQDWEFPKTDEIVDLNKEDFKVIVSVEGIGKTKANAIIKARPIKFLEQLLDVRGFTIDNLRDLADKVKPSLKDITDRVDLNKATPEEIIELPGINKTLTNLIIKKRPYEFLEDVIAVKGMIRKNIIEIRHLVLPELEDPNSKRLVNINKASERSLLKLEGITKSNVKALIKNREYKYLDGLLKVEGFTEAIINKFKDKVKPAYLDETILDLNRSDDEALLTLPGLSEFKLEVIKSLRHIRYLDKLTITLYKEDINKFAHRVKQIWEEDEEKDPDDKDEEEEKPDDQRVNLNEASFEQIAELKQLKTKQEIAQLIYERRPYTFLDNVKEVPGVNHKLLKKLAPDVLPKFRTKSDINITPAAKKAIVKYIESISPNQLMEDIKVSVEQATTIVNMKPYSSFDDFLLNPVVNPRLIKKIMSFLGLANDDDKKGKKIVATDKQKKLILSFIHTSSPSEIIEAGIAEHIAVEIHLKKPYASWDTFVELENVTQALVNTIITFLDDEDDDGKSKLKVIVDYINSVKYNEWREIDIPKSKREMIYGNRTYESHDALLALKGVTVKLLLEIYDLIFAPKLKKIVDLNKGTLEKIKELKGVSEARAELIIKNRPYKNLNDFIFAGFSKALARKLEPQVKQKFLPRMDLNEISVEDMSIHPLISSKMAGKIAQLRPITYLDDLLAIKLKVMSMKYLRSIEDDVFQNFFKNDKKSRFDLNICSYTELQSIDSVTRSIAETIKSLRPIKYLDELVEAGIELDKVKDIGKRCIQIFEADEKEDDDEDEDDEDDKPDIEVDLNHSTVLAISKVPGITVKQAEIITYYRSYLTLDELLYIKKIGISGTRKLIGYTTQKMPERRDINEMSIDEISEIPCIKLRQKKIKRSIAREIFKSIPYENLEDLEKVKYVTKTLTKFLSFYITLPQPEEDDKPDLDKLVNLNKGDRESLRQKIRMLTNKRADWIISKRPIRYLDDLMGGPMTRSQLETLDPKVVQTWDDNNNKDRDSDFPIDLNVAIENDMTEIPGINKARAEYIIKQRPIEWLTDIIGGPVKISHIHMMRPHVLQTFEPINIPTRVLTFLNAAEDYELEDIKGIGQKLSSEILDARLRGPINSDNVMLIYGMTPEIINNIVSFLTDEDNDFDVINLKKDEVEKLRRIPGLEAVAEMIVNFRPFKHLDELIGIPTITREYLESIEGTVTPKLEHQYDINKSSQTRLAEIMSGEEASYIINRRPFEALDDMLDTENDVLDRLLIRQLSMTPGVSLKRDRDRMSKKEKEELASWNDRDKKSKDAPGKLVNISESTNKKDSFFDELPDAFLDHISSDLFKDNDAWEEYVNKLEGFYESVSRDVFKREMKKLFNNKREDILEFGDEPDDYILEFQFETEII